MDKGAATASAVELSKSQLKALSELDVPGHYRVNWRPNLSPDGYRGLVDGGFVEEVWTWASATRPDVGITEKGCEARKLARGTAPNPSDEELSGSGVIK